MVVWALVRGLEGLVFKSGSGTLMSTEGGLVRTFLALASPPARSTGTAIGIREAEGETPTACCAWALFLAALSKTTLSAG